MTPLALPYTAWQPPLRAGRAVIAGVAGTSASLPRVVAVAPSNGQHCVLRRPVPEPPAEYLPRSRSAVFTARDGHEVHAVVPPPRNPDFQASGRERVPFLLCLNDDPAARAMGKLDRTSTFFTSRGFGVAEIHGRGRSRAADRPRDRCRRRYGPAVLADTGLCPAATVYAPVTDLGPTAPAAPHALADRLRALACDSAPLRPSSWPAAHTHRTVLMPHGPHDTAVPATHALEVKLSFYGQVLGFHPQQTRHLRMHARAERRRAPGIERHLAATRRGQHTRMTSWTGTPVPHNKANPTPVRTAASFPAQGGLT